MNFTKQTICACLSVLVVGCALPIDSYRDDGKVGGRSDPLSFSFTPPPMIPKPAIALPLAPQYTLMGETGCRALTLFTQRLPYAEQTWAAMGMTSWERYSLRTSAHEARRLACAGDTENSLFSRQVRNIDTQVNALVERVAGQFSVSRERAMDIFQAQTMYDIRTFLEQCGGAQIDDQTTDYLIGDTSTSPPASAPMGPSCSSPLATGGSSWGSNTQPGGRSCITRAVGAVSTECEMDADDPPGNDDGEDTEGASDGSEGASDGSEEGSAEGGADGDPNTRQLTPTERRHLESLRDEVQRRIDAETEQATSSSGGSALIGIGAGVVGAITAVLLGAEIAAAAVVVLSAIAVAFLVDWMFHTNYAADLQQKLDQIEHDLYSPYISFDCPGFPTHGGVAMYENPFLGTSISFGDLITECFCQAATNTTGVYLGPQDSCGNADVADRRDCMLNPIGPDDAPRPECIAMLEEDNEPWQWSSDPADAICQALSCPSGMTSLAAGDGSCACFEEIPPEQELATHCDAVLCPSGQTAVPMPDGSCQCNASAGSGYDLNDGFDLPETPIDPDDFPSPFPGPLPGF